MSQLSAPGGRENGRGSAYVGGRRRTVHEQRVATLGSKGRRGKGTPRTNHNKTNGMSARIKNGGSIKISGETVIR